MMKHIIIGTAGHIDHGKTSLIRALTGRDCDRFEEEKRRGITIDLGFTYFDLPGGMKAGIVDVPGHEKFINNMVAGVVGMDMVLLVIAADEGIMPQTREHMDILSYLGVEKSIIVLNKCDLVEDEWQDLVEEEIKEELSDTFLKDAPIVRVSAATGEGLQKLTQTISQMVDTEVKEKESNTIPRLPVDRVFSIAGFGTVVTGTLISGTICKEDELMIYPGEMPVKIRSIQVHGEDCERAYAGQRVAINLSNVKKNELRRGDVLAPPESMHKSDVIDVRLDLLKDTGRILKNRSRLHLFTGTTEVLCRAVLLDTEEMGAKDSALVQLRLETPIAVKRGDRFVVRFYSPMETIGGGVILEPNARIKKRFRGEDIEELRRKESGGIVDVLEYHIKAHGDTMITVTELASLTAHTVEEVEAAAGELADAGKIYTFPMRKGTYLWHGEQAYALWHEIADDIRHYEKEYPYRYGMKKAHVQTAYFRKMKANVADAALLKAEEEGILCRREEYLSTPEFEISKDETYKKIRGIFLRTYEAAGYDFVRYQEMDFGEFPLETVDDIRGILLSEGEIVQVFEEMYSLPRLMEAAAEKIAEQLESNPVITIANVRDLFGNSRKSAKPMLMYMDKIKVTKKGATETERVAFS